MSGLVALAFYDPSGDTHFSLCPLALSGFDFCPGCGLGRAVSLFLHGEIAQSFAIHPLGIFAVIVLSYRIIELLKPYLRTHGKNN
jgi:hypothetical protein